MWKKFDFFTAELLQSESPTSGLYAIQAMDITCTTGGNGQLFFADSEGGITISNQNYSLIRFQAHRGCINCVYFHKSTNILFTFASSEDLRNSDTISKSHEIANSIRTSLYMNATYDWMVKDLGLSRTVLTDHLITAPELKLWRLNTTDSNGIPECIRTFSLFQPSVHEVLCCVSMNEENELLVFGCISGSIYYIQGDIPRSKRITPIKLTQSLSSTITGLHITPNDDKNSLYLYALTNTTTNLFIIPRTNRINIKYEILDKTNGCSFHCSCIADNGELFIGRDGGIFRYRGYDGIGCYSFVGSKQFIECYKDCLLICMNVNNNQQIIICNRQARLIEYQGIIKRLDQTEWISDIFTEWGDIFLLSKNHSVICLHKLDLQSRLSILYEQKRFTLALSLAHSNDLYYNSIVEIHKMYGDYLYDQNIYDEAVIEYVKTIGIIEPSYVIRKFLDSHRLPNLTDYLEALHKQGKANEDHTTLLLKCYAKMYREEKLREFVQNDGDSMKFNIKTAIRVLSECGCVKEALTLSLKSHHSKEYISLLLTESHDYEKAIQYIGSLSFTEADSIIQEYGRILLDMCGDSTTSLLIRICIGYIPISIKNEKTMSNENSLRDSIHISIHSKQPLDSTRITNAAPAIVASLGGKMLEIMSGNPSSYIHLFGSHIELLVTFLCEVVKREKECDSSTWNTLLELLLHRSSIQYKNDQYINNEIIQTNSMDDVVDLLKNPTAKYDDEDALVLVQTYRHIPGQIYLYTKAGMYSLLLQHYLHMNDSNAAIKICKEHGDHDQDLWVQLIMILSQQKTVNPDILKEILDYIEKSHVLPLLYVLQLISQNETVQLQMVSKYIIRQLSRQRGIIQNDKEKISDVLVSNQGLKREINSLMHGARLFQTTKCSNCNLPLELPVIHYLCGHSYHKSCLTIEQDGCSRCAHKFKPYLTLPPAPTEDEFFQALKQGRDGFGVTADFFGKRMFTSLETKEKKKKKK